MANDYIRVAADGTGKFMDAESFDRAGTTIYRERVQVGGTSDSDVVVATTAAPAAAAVGMAVRVAGSAQVSGAVSVSAMPAVSGTVTVQGAVTVATQLGTAVVSVVPGVSVTVQQGVSVSAQVSGTVSVVAPGSTTGSSGMSGVLVWLGASQSVLATVVTQLGTQIVSVVPGVSVTIQQGASVSAVVSGTITAIPVNQTTAVPSASATGQVMWIVGGQSTTAFPVVVTGTVTAGAGTTVVSLTGSALVSGTVTVAGSVAISGTGLVSVVPGVSVNLGGLANVVVTTTATSGVSGAMIWLGVGQTLAALNTVVTVLGTQIVSVVPGVSVTIQQGASVSAVVSGTVTAIPVNQTTAVPSASATGQVMWIAGGQSTTAFPIVVTGTVTAGAGTTVVSVTGSVTVVAGLSVSAVVSGSVTPLGMVFTTADQAAVSTALVVRGTVSVLTGTAVVSGTVTVLGSVAISGTGLVSVVPGLSVSAVVSGTVTAVPANQTTAVPSASATGQVMWIAGGQSTTAFPVVVTGTVTAGAGTTVVSVTGSVTVVAGLSVSAVVSGTVTVIAPGSTTGSSGMSGLLVWLGAGQTIATVGTIATVLGTQIVSNAPGQSVSVVGSVLTIVTQLGTQVVSVVPGLSVSAVVSGTVSNVGLLFTTGMATVASTGQVVVPKDFAREPVVIDISSTVVGSSTTMLMTVYTGATAVTTGASFWVVPAGKVFRVMNMNIVAVSSAVLGQAKFVVIVATAAVSLSVVATVGIAAVLPFAIEASTAPFALGAYLADVAGGTTVGVGIKGGTSCSILGAVVSGYLF